MKRIKQAIRRFFVPPSTAHLWRKLLPWATLAAVVVVVFSGGSAAWEYTNSPQFCGTTCHTMPPEYTAYQVSPHARILCVECHIGRDFMGGGFVLRKAGDVKHVFATVFTTYKYPIMAEDMRPARETCERCHSPDKFASDSLKEIKRFGTDVNNTPTSIFLTLKTGGGNKRQGLGKGIHWHIQSKVYYLATDELDQDIPFVRVMNDDGTSTDYYDVNTNFDTTKIDTSKLKEMDCMTCHNRITHLIMPPTDAIDQLMATNIISPKIPEIRLKAAEVLSQTYPSTQVALDNIATLKGFYQTTYPEFYAANSAQIDGVISTLQDTYKQSFFPDQKDDWATHPNNVGHRFSPGCFRCHDGQHFNNQQQAIPMECNLCHNVPVVVGPDKFVANIEISRGPEPQTHLNSNWMAMHYKAFNPACATCHTTQNAGGKDNSSFCSNSGCHGNTWTYANLDAPALQTVIQSQIPPTPTPMPTPVATATPQPTPGAAAPVATDKLTYNDTVQAIFTARCGACHNETAMADLNLLTYAAAMKGGKDGAVIVPNDPAASLLIKIQSAPHFGQLNLTELQQVTDWIKAGALEK
ncbi:MAG: NapC/NirT family cytochrome c [Anaerolineae bacterium]